MRSARTISFAALLNSFIRDGRTAPRLMSLRVGRTCQRLEELSEETGEKLLVHGAFSEPPMGMETELKFRLPARSMATLAKGRGPGATEGRSERARLVSTYFD